MVIKEESMVFVVDRIKVRDVDLCVEQLISFAMHDYRRS